MIVPVNELQIGNISSMVGSNGRPICKFDFLGGGLTRCFFYKKPLYKQPSTRQPKKLRNF